MAGVKRAAQWSDRNCWMYPRDVITCGINELGFVCCLGRLCYWWKVWRCKVEMWRCQAFRTVHTLFFCALFYLALWYSFEIDIYWPPPALMGFSCCSHVFLIWLLLLKLEYLDCARFDPYLFTQTLLWRISLSALARVLCAASCCVSAGVLCRVSADGGVVLVDCVPISVFSQGSPLQNNDLWFSCIDNELCYLYIIYIVDKTSTV